MESGANYSAGIYYNSHSISAIRRTKFRRPWRFCSTFFADHSLQYILCSTFFADHGDSALVSVAVSPDFGRCRQNPDENTKLILTEKKACGHLQITVVDAVLFLGVVFTQLFLREVPEDGPAVVHVVSFVMRA